MLTVKQITTTKKKVHDTLSTNFYKMKRAGLVDKKLQEVFNTSHAELDTKFQADIKLASDYIEPKPVRDLAKEIDELKEVIAKLKVK